MILSNTQQYSTPPTPSNRVDYPLIVNETPIQSPRQDPRFRSLATHKITNHPSISATRRNTELQRLDTNSLQLKFEFTVDFENLIPQPISTHAHVHFKTTPHPFKTTNLNLFVSDDPPFPLLNGSFTFFLPSPVLNIPLNFDTFLIVLSLLSLCNTTNKNIVEPNDPHISDLLVSHDDCSKQNNLRQISLTRIQTREQAPSSLEYKYSCKI